VDAGRIGTAPRDDGGHGIALGSGKSIPKPEHLQALAQLAAVRGMTRGFLDRYQNLRDRERVGTGLAHGVIVESHEVGTHTVQLLEDGSLVVNNSIRIERR
jgi:hypothetical protein